MLASDPQELVWETCPKVEDFGRKEGTERESDDLIVMRTKKQDNER